MKKIAIAPTPRGNRALIDALKSGEAVELVYHGEALGRAMPTRPHSDRAAEEKAMAAFFGSGAGRVGAVAGEARALRCGRNSRYDAI